MGTFQMSFDTDGADRIPADGLPPAHGLQFHAGEELVPPERHREFQLAEVFGGVGQPLAGGGVLGVGVGVAGARAQAAGPLRRDFQFDTLGLHGILCWRSRRSRPPGLVASG